MLTNPSSKTHPIYIAELLALIFSFLDDRSVARAARVSKQWSDVALDKLWHLVTDLRPLLTLLAPLSTSERRSRHCETISLIKFRRPLRSSDWNRFDFYARRIRAIDIDDVRHISRRKQLDPSIYDEIARTCPRRDVLPNIHSLSWYTNDAVRQQRSLLFTHETISHLAIRLHHATDSPLSAYVDQILIRAPNISKLEIRSETPMRMIQHDVLAFLRGLPGLKHLVLPMYCLTASVVTELATAPELEDISFARPIEHGTGDRDDVASFVPTLNEGAFASLKKLSFSAHMQHAIQFLSSPFAPRNLTCLHYHILAIDNPPVLRELLRAMSQCRRLTEVVLDYMVAPGSPILIPPPPPAGRPNLECLRPLLACRDLKKFEIRWDYQFNLSEDDVGELASCWPALEYLHLNSEPIPEQSTPILGLQAIVPFARHCPRLRELALYLDGDRQPPHHPTTLPDPFRYLRKLAVGSSPVTAAESTALFLSHLCPATCEVVAGVRWPDAYGIALDQAGMGDEARMKLAEWWVKWGEVGKVLPLAVKVRQDEKARLAALQQEMNVLCVSRREERLRLEQLENEVRELKGRRKA